MQHIEEVTAGLDWLTMTLPVGAVLDQLFVENALRCLDEIVKEGYTLEYRSLLGYDGVSAGGSFVGTRADSHLVQFSGRFADQFFERTYRYDAHVSRADVQVTVRHRKMPTRVAKEGYRDATAENQTLSAGRRRKIWLITGSDGGDTLYIGSVSSDARGRLYNKEVQSEDPKYARTWRYEVMLRNEHASGLCRSYETRIANRTQFCSDYVAVWYETRGVMVPWTQSDSYVPVPPIKTLPTDTERKLNWLRHQVKPTVEYLLTQVEKETILQLLGLS